MCMALTLGVHGGEEAAPCLSDNVPVLRVGFCVVGFQMHKRCGGAQMGLTASGAVRAFLTRVVANKEWPFGIKALENVTLTNPRTGEAVLRGDGSS